MFGFNESLRMELKKDGKDGVKTTCVVRRRWGGSQCEADVARIVSHCYCRCACCLVLLLHSSSLRDGDCVISIRDDVHCSPYYVCGSVPVSCGLFVLRTKVLLCLVTCGGSARTSSTPACSTASRHGMCGYCWT